MSIRYAIYEYLRAINRRVRGCKSPFIIFVRVDLHNLGVFMIVYIHHPSIDSIEIDGDKPTILLSFKIRIELKDRLIYNLPFARHMFHLTTTKHLKFPSIIHMISLSILKSQDFNLFLQLFLYQLRGFKVFTFGHRVI